MARTQVDDTGVRVSFERWEKRGGFLHDQHLRLDQIVSVEAVDDLAVLRLGLRSPGYGGLRRRVGTYRSRGVRRLVCATRGRPAWMVRLRDHRYDEVIIGADDARAVAADIATRLTD